MSKSRRVTGMIAADRMYSAAALSENGIGREIQMQMRADGVKPRRIGVAYWYAGCEVIDWMKEQKQVELIRKPQGESEGE
ncbi:hypothetical protein OAG71_02540 [bacterium]|nr:hypothetical protein [bacterium]